MRKFLTPIMMFFSLLLFLQVPVYSQQRANDSPPVSQALVREGDFAIELVQALKLGVSRDEAEAESTLASFGIAPRNGWIADYPMTPDIIVEVQSAVGAAASTGKLSLSRVEAEEAVRIVITDLDLPDTAAAPGDVQNSYVPAENGSYYYDTTALDSYYYDEGPPVITYYTSPWDYSYLYSWVPFPFWCGGAFFGGFFILHDFDRVVGVHRHFHGNNVFVNTTVNKRVTNHLTTNGFRQVTRVDPVARSTGAAWKTAPNMSATRGFNSREAQNSAQSILTRGVARAPSGETGSLTAGTGRGFNAESSIASGSAARSGGQIGANRNDGLSSLTGSGGSQFRSSAPERSVGMTGNAAVSPPARPNINPISGSNSFENRGGISPPQSFHAGGGGFSSPHSGGTAVGGFHSGSGSFGSFRGGGLSLGTFHSGGSAFSGIHSSGSSFGGFHNGASSLGGFHSSGSSLSGFHGGGGSLGGFHGGGGSAGGFNGGGFGHGGGGGHGGR